MKRYVWVCLLVSLTLGIANAQNGECGDGGGLLFRARCFSAACAGTVLIAEFGGCTDPSTCTFWEESDVECCNVPTPVWTPAGSCGIAFLKDRQTREQLALLSADENIMIPSCGGAYVPARTLLSKTEVNQ